MSLLAQLDKSTCDSGNVQEVSKQPSVGSSGPDRQPNVTPETPKPTESKPEKLGKTHVNYWKKRLYRNSFTRDGHRYEVNDWSVKIQHLGCRRAFSLNSANKDTAAAKARDIYVAIVGKGWAAAEALYNPDMIARKDDPSLGDFLAEVETKASLKPKTFRNYASSFRTIVAGVLNIDDDKSKYDYRAGGQKKWIAAVDAAKLSRITPDRIQAWKVSYLKAADPSLTDQASAKRTINSYIRCARCLFSKGILKFLKLRLPQPLPFDGVELEEAGSMRYKSKIKPELLVMCARNELRKKHPESYKTFLLALLSGLRRSEIDLLEWEAIDWANNRIWIGNTKHFSVKTDDSEDFVEVDPEVLAELRGMKGTVTPFVLNSSLPPRVGLSRQYYRCQHVFRHLTEWLRSKGIDANKPIHELRKEFGSLVNQKFT